jgi:NAD(P)H-dependent FMN reductase
VDFKHVSLKDVNLKACRGCGLCLEKGEEFCALKDDREHLLAMMREADGVIFATPVYSLQVTALMKNFLDRLSYIFHRPCFFHKAFIPIAVQGVYGAKGTLSYLDEVARFWGFKTCPGLGLTVPWDKPLPEEQQKIDEKLDKAAKRFYTPLNDPGDPIPGFKDVLIFRSVRTVHSQAAGFKRDHDYYKEQGWFTSDYYYPTKLGLLKKIIGAWVEKQTIKQSAKNKKERSS